MRKRNHRSFEQIFMGGAVLFFAVLSLLGTAFGSWIQTEAPGTAEITDITVGNVYDAFEVKEPTPFTLCQDGFLDPATGIISSSGSLAYAVSLNAEAVAAVVSDGGPTVISGRLVDRRTSFFAQGGMTCSYSTGGAFETLSSLDGSELPFSFELASSSSSSFLLTFAFEIADRASFRSWFLTLSNSPDGYRPAFELELSLAL